MSEGSWDKVAGNVDFNLDIDRARFMDLVAREARILDFGCGYGRITRDLAEYGYAHVTGVDPSCAMIERGRQDFPGLSLRHLAGSELPFDDSTFDAVIICAVFTCIPEAKGRNDVAAELNRVLKPGGIVHVSEFCSRESQRFVSGFGIPMWYSTPRELRGLFDSFICLHDEVVSVDTMSGEAASNYRAFIRKPPNRAMHEISAC
ncbi:class I SAM-dependent methyltransferase [Alloalcanivorax xenomutans]|uniref:class I SAM-dependent methyltransferase n=1 Tax=Alloalcanivorax xenomutans TaxID=1094342 RepID=UPI003C561B36